MLAVAMLLPLWGCAQTDSTPLSFHGQSMEAASQQSSAPESSAASIPNSVPNIRERAEALIEQTAALPDGPLTPALETDVPDLTNMWLHFLSSEDQTGTFNEWDASINVLMYRFEHFKGSVQFGAGLFETDAGVQYLGEYNYLGDDVFTAKAREWVLGGNDESHEEMPLTEITFKVQWPAEGRDKAVFTLLSCGNDGRFAPYLDIPICFVRLDALVETGF